MRAALKFDWGDLSGSFHGRARRQPKGNQLLLTLPMNPLAGYVMGIEEFETGRMPTDDEHARCAASCTRRWTRAPAAVGAASGADGPRPVQRDSRCSPMNTDVMHEGPCHEMARVLASAARVPEMTLSSWDPRQDAKH